MDIAQSIELIDVLKESYGFDIGDNSKEELCFQIAAIVLGQKWKKAKTIDLIGSMSAVTAFVFRLEREHQFAAVPHEKRHMIAIKIVTEAKIMVTQKRKN